MAMLVEREDMEFFLIPTMEAERDSIRKRIVRVSILDIA